MRTETTTGKPHREDDALADVMLGFLNNEDTYQKLESHTKVEIVEWLQQKGYIKDGVIDQVLSKKK